MACNGRLIEDAAQINIHAGFDIGQLVLNSDIFPTLDVKRQPQLPRTDELDLRFSSVRRVRNSSKRRGMQALDLDVALDRWNRERREESACHPRRCAVLGIARMRHGRVDFIPCTSPSRRAVLSSQRAAADDAAYCSSKCDLIKIEPALRFEILVNNPDRFNDTLPELRSLKSAFGLYRDGRALSVPSAIKSG
jgi:hypothetical protein